MGAIAYTDELLANIQTILANSIETTRSRSETFLSTMQVYLDTVDANRASLVPDSLNDGATDPAASLEPSVEAPIAEEPKVEAPRAASAASSDDEVPALDIPEQFFNKE